MSDFTVAVDFDGTVVTFAYPKVGQSVGAEPVLRRLLDEGARLVLLTMRDGDDLRAAVRWFTDRRIPLWGVNHNPEQHRWTGSSKVHANLYIDDSNLGVPLRRGLSDRPYVDWEAVETLIFGPGGWLEQRKMK